MSMTMDEFLEYTGFNPVIPAVKNDEWLMHCQDSDSMIAYTLYGDIRTIPHIVNTLKEMGKKVMVQVDLVDGLSSQEISVDFIKEYTRADGIISTKPAIIRRANQLGLFTIHRFFMIDYITYANIVKHSKGTDPNVVELMPAALPKVVRYLRQVIDKPIISSGLVLDKEDVIIALSAGAHAVSTTNRDVW